MGIRRLALRIAPPSIFSLLLACAGGEQGATGATSAATTGETTTGSISASSTNATDATDPSTDATDATTVTTGEATTGPGGCMKDSDCLDGLACENGECVFCPDVQPMRERGAAALVERARGCDGCSGEAVVEIPIPAPNLVLVPDRSGSMAAAELDHDGDPNTPAVSRWQVLYSGLEALIEAHDQALKLGLMFLPGEAATDAYDLSACVTSATPELPTALANGAMLLDALPPGTVPTLAGATPMRAALRAATDHLLAIDDGRGKAILLLADGAANCDPDAADEATRFESLDAGVLPAVAEARAAGVRTFVIGLDAAEEPAPIIVDKEPDGVSPGEFLAEVAQAGGDHPYVNVSDQAGLDQAIADIISGLIPCVVDLDPAPMWPEAVTLKVAGVAYGEALEGICGDADGWRYVDPKLEQIELCGAACEQAQVAGVFDVEYRCPSASR